VLTPRDILQAEFKRVWKGYNPDEVDAFLHRVVGEYETLYRENERLRERIKELEARIDEYSRTSARSKRPWRWPNGRRTTSRKRRERKPRRR